MSKQSDEITLQILLSNVEKYENKIKKLSEDHEAAYQKILEGLNNGSIIGVRQREFYFEQGFAFLSDSQEPLQKRLGTGFTCKIERPNKTFTVSF